jgi:hypothetical protein
MGRCGQVLGRSGYVWGQSCLNLNIFKKPLKPSPSRLSFHYYLPKLLKN